MLHSLYLVCSNYRISNGSPFGVSNLRLLSVKCFHALQQLIIVSKAHSNIPPDDSVVEVMVNKLGMGDVITHPSFL